MRQPGCAHVGRQQHQNQFECGGCGEFVYCSELCADIHWGEGEHHLKCIGAKRRVYNVDDEESYSSGEEEDGEEKLPSTKKKRPKEKEEEDVYDPAERERALAALRRRGEEMFAAERPEQKRKFEKERRRPGEDLEPKSEGEMEADERQKRGFFEEKEEGYNGDVILTPEEAKEEAFRLIRTDHSPGGFGGGTPLSYAKIAEFALDFLREEGEIPLEQQEWFIDVPIDEIPREVLPHMRTVYVHDYRILKREHPFWNINIYVANDKDVVKVERPENWKRIEFSRRPYWYVK